MQKPLSAILTMYQFMDCPKLMTTAMYFYLGYLSIYLGRPSGRPAEATIRLHSILSSIRDLISLVLSTPASRSRLSMYVVDWTPRFLV